MDKTVVVSGSKQARERGQGAAYCRVIATRSVTVRCARCGQEETQDRYPGPMPRYCHTCAQEMARERTRLRVQRHRQQEQRGSSSITTANDSV
jgi:late competence protein required for DNA uptake (superfamily II DNA/RNA helicase)